MKRSSTLLLTLCLLLLISLLIAPQWFASAQSEQNVGCFHGLTPRLTIGAMGQVLPGNANNIRDQAVKGGKLLAQMPAGSTFEVLDGPKCVNAMNWWQVNFIGVVGWTVESTSEEYWLRPYDPYAPQPLTPTNGIEYIYEGISFELNPALAAGVFAGHGDSVLRDPNVDVAQAFAPKGVEFTFNDTKDNTLPLSLRVYSVADFVNQEPSTEKTFARLRDDLDNLPDWRFPEGEISVLSIVSQPQLFRARIGKLNFSNGRGYRFLTQASFDVRPIINPIDFRYGGLTYDDAYYVVVEGMILTHLLPGRANPSDSGADFDSHFAAYRDGVVDKLNKADGDAFSLNLDQIDDLIKSLQVHGPDFKVTADGGTLHAHYDNISFDVPAGFAKDIDYQISPADWVSMNAMPEHVCFGIQGNALSTGSSAGTNLCIIPTEGMEWYVKGLEPFLKDKPALTVADALTTIPVPIAGVRQQILAQVHYLDTNVLHGVRFVTSYAQMDWPIGGKSLWYNFSGLTARGSYIVFMESSALTTLLPDVPSPVSNAQLAVINANPIKYYQDIIDMINAGSPTDFDPNPEIMDAIIKSIHFG